MSNSNSFSDRHLTPTFLLLKGLFLACFILTFFVLNTHASTELVSTAPGSVRGLSSNEVVKFETGKKITLSSIEPQLVEFQDRIPILLVPYGNSHQIDLDSPKVDATFNRRTQEEASKLLSPLVAEIIQVQAMIQKKRFKEARDVMGTLKAKYPNIAFLDFIWGSVLAVTGDREGAKQAIERGLLVHPDYEEGKLFLKRLKGEN